MAKDSKGYIHNTNPMEDDPSGLQQTDAVLYGADPQVTLRAKKMGLKTDIDGTVRIGSFTLTRVGLQVTDKFDENDWNRAGEIVCDLGKSVQWILGDLLKIGEQRKYKTDYEFVAEKTGYEVVTLRNLVYVCSTVDVSRRRDTLRFGHHANVAAYAPHEQDEWLQKAEVGKWSVSQMRAAMKPKPTPLSDVDEPLATLTQARAEMIRSVAKLAADTSRRGEALAQVREWLSLLKKIEKQLGG